MNMKVIKFNQIALLFVFTGILSYISLDSGLYDYMAHNVSFLNLKEKPTVKSDAVEMNQLSVQTLQVKSSLIKLEEAFIEEQKNLDYLSKQSLNLENNIIEKKNELMNIEKKIGFLSNELNTKTDLANRFLASTKNSLDSDQMNASEQKLSRFQDKISSSTGVSTHVIPVKHNNTDYLRVKTALSYANVDSSYLSETGLRQINKITEELKNMGFKRITLAYTSVNDLNRDRISSVKNYIKILNRKNEKPKTLNLQNDFDLEDSFEIWASRGLTNEKN